MFRVFSSYLAWRYGSVLHCFLASDYVIIHVYNEVTKQGIRYCSVVAIGAVVLC